MNLKQEFEDWMERVGLSPATVGKYAEQTAENQEVQEAMRIVTGNENMYSCTSKSQLLHAIALISSMEFDIVGHGMYSAALKKYLKFLEETGAVNP